MEGTVPDAQTLVCPETRLSLRETVLDKAMNMMGGRIMRRRTRGPTPFPEPTRTVMLREDLECAYPVVGGIPILLLPEQLVSRRDPGANDLDTSEPRYAESYAEMSYYNPLAHRETELIEASPAAATLSRVLDFSPEKRRLFPEPRWAWLDAAYEPVAQWEAFRHVAPVADKTVLQLGGKGTDAVRFLLAGAAKAWLLSPMLEELERGRALARHMGVEDGYRCVAGIAEETPFADEMFDAIYSGGSVHHMVTALACAEIRRILRPGGKFAAVEPWQAPFYGWGIRVFGKREPGVQCHPLTMERARPFAEVFDETAVVHHGAMTRYPLLALAQLGWELRPSSVYRITRIDDACCSLVPPLRRVGSSTAILATRGT